MKGPMLALTALLVATALFAQEASPAPPAAAPRRPAADAAAQPATLTLHRPAKRGDAYTLTMDAAIHAEGRMAAGDAMEAGGAQDVSFSFAGQVRLLDVTPAGEPSVLLVKLEKAQVTKEKAKTEPLKVQGAEIGVSFPDGKPHFIRRDGQEIPKEEAMILGQIFQPPTGIDEEKLLGPGRPVRPGESWPLDKGTLMEEFKAGMPADAKLSAQDVEGTATYLGVEPWDGVPCQKVAADFALKTGDVGRFIGESQTRIHQEILLPVDATSKATRRTSEVTTALRGKVRTDNNQLIDVRSQNKITATVEMK